MMKDLDVPSDVARLNYFFGQLLTQRDLQAEQGYHLVLQRLLQRETLGTGTVAGLRVDAPPDAAPRGVFVRAGLAMDPGGRELVLANDVCIEIAAEAAVPGAAGLAGTDFDGLAASLNELWGQPIDAGDLEALAAELAALGVIPTADAGPLRDALDRLVPPDPFELPAGSTLADHLLDALVATTYVGVRYLERGAEPTPASLDASCCGEAQCFPARVREGVSIVAQPTPFDVIEDPYHNARVALHTCFGAEETTPPPNENSPFTHACRRCLCELLLGSWRGLPVAADPCNTGVLPVVPLAIVRWSRFAGPGASRILDIDNCAIRPLAPGVPALRALLDAITQCTSPGPQLPIITAVEPADGAELAVEPGARAATVIAESSMPLVAGAVRWHLDLHPIGGARVLRLDEDNAATDTFRAATTIEKDESGRPVRIELGFQGPEDGQSLALPPGTYVWRINAPGAELRAPVTGAALDGEPAAAGAVPSGNGRPGGEFELRFFVRPRRDNT